MTAIDQAPQRPASVESSWESEITPEKPLLHLPLGEIWRYRDLILLTVWRDFISVHKQTIFGPLWYFAQPLVSTLVYQIVFGKIAQLPTNNIPPFLFYMSGIVIWYYFSACLSRTSTTFSSNAALFTKVYISQARHSDRAVYQQYLAVPDSVAHLSRLLLLFFGKRRADPTQLSHRDHTFPGLADCSSRVGSGMPYLGAKHTIS